jgi:hypothetical protein
VRGALTEWPGRKSLDEVDRSAGRPCGCAWDCCRLDIIIGRMNAVRPPNTSFNPPSRVADGGCHQALAGRPDHVCAPATVDMAMKVFPEAGG